MTVMTRVHMLALACFLTLAGAAHSAPKAYVHFINVGQGDATLIEFPCAVMLIDVGGDEVSKPRFRRYLNNFFARRKHLSRTIDLLVLTHSHYDHTRNLRFVTENFKIRNILTNGRNQRDQSWLHDWVDRRGSLNYRPIVVDDIPRGGLRSATVDPIACKSVDPKITAYWGRVANPPLSWGPRVFRDPNNHSLVMRIDYGRSSMLFTGDLEGAGLTSMMERYGTSPFNVDLLKIGHHGFRSGTTQEFLDAVSPELAVLSRERVRPWFIGLYEAYSRKIRRKRTPLTIDVWNYGQDRPTRRERRAARRAGIKLKWGIDRGIRMRRVLDKAIYWTGIDGTIVVEASVEGKLRLKSR